MHLTKQLAILLKYNAHTVERSLPSGFWGHKQDGLTISAAPISLTDLYGTHGVPKSAILAEVAPKIKKLKKTNKLYIAMQCIAIQVGG